MTENNFSEQYRLLRTAELLDIIDNANDYQPAAVEVAQLELDSRRLTAEEFTEARDELDSRRQHLLDKQRKSIAYKIESVGLSVFDTFRPVREEALTTGKYIKIISFSFIGYFLYCLFRDFSLFRFIYIDSEGWNFSLVVYFLHHLFLPVAGFLFWRREKIGWILVAVYCVYLAATNLVMFIRSLRFYFAVTDDVEDFIFFPAPSPTDDFFTLLIIASLIWILFQKNIREVYRIGTQTILATSGFGVILLMYLLFL